jgi:hypothetical protein
LEGFRLEIGLPHRAFGYDAHEWRGSNDHDDDPCNNDDHDGAADGQRDGPTPRECGLGSGLGLVRRDQRIR